MPRLVKLGFIVLVIAIVSAGGWVVWGKNSDTDKKALEDNSSQQTPDQDTAGPNEDDSDKYLVISEWGVRITLPESLRGDVKYGLQTRLSEQTEVASFEIGRLLDISGNNCGLYTDPDESGITGGIGVMLIRRAVDLPDPEGVGKPIYTSSDNQYEYYATSMKAPCAQTNENLQLETGGALSAALKKVEEIERN